MVEYSINYDQSFLALADATRRDIIRRLLVDEQTISQLAGRYNLTFAAVAKHLEVLARAHLVRKRKRGRERVVSIDMASLQQLRALLDEYEQLWTGRFDRLDALITIEREMHDKASSR